MTIDQMMEYITLHTQAFSIIHPKAELKLKLEEIDGLHAHEEVIPDILRKLTGEIKREGHLRHPLIVDLKTHVVLDGMHRLAAINNLGCRFIPTCLVDYENPNIIVDCWYPVINHKSTLDGLVNAVKASGFTAKEYSMEKARKLVNERKALTSVISRSKCFVLYGSQESIRDTYEAIRSIESKFESRGFSVGYFTYNDALERVISGKALSMLFVPKVTKQNVINVALKGEVFVHKTTRHVIPVRPLCVNAKLEWLEGKLGLEKANRAFVEHLSRKEVNHLPPGQILDRRYEEELYMFK